ncbi:MAG: ABC transporter permease [Kordiimonadaceae bacterium]|nr:ABC transporter permease [Kordiimonadaceae bacterium]
MLSYIFRKLLLAIPTLFIVSIIVFGLMRLIPGDPVAVIAGDIKDVKLLAVIRADYGLDKPITTQYAVWIGKILSGDLGNSIITGTPVLETAAKRFIVTAQLVLPALLLSVLVAIPAGLYAAWKQNQGADAAIMVTVVLAISIPSFWVGMLLILVFGVWLGWLPTVGYVSPGDNFIEGITYLLLPVISIMFVELASITRMMRSNAIDVMRQDYISHARAKGASETRVLYKHALKNAFAPTLTLLGLMLGSLLGGAAVVETVFSLPGLGRFLVDGIYARDYPVVQGVLLLVSVVYVATNLLVDLLYPVFDPRIKL